jgi:hypothetical protein
MTEHKERQPRSLGETCPKSDAPQDDGTVRKFESGATRDTAEGKLDFEAFLSPTVLLRYAEYLNANRRQSDGSLRDGDNWQKGIPFDTYMKSKYRHFMDTWLLHRGYKRTVKTDIETSLCAEMFNTMGYLFEVLKAKEERL